MPSNTKLLHKVCSRSVRKLKGRPRICPDMQPTIFDTLLQPHLNKNRPVPSDAELTAEAVLMLLAGTDTTANALVVGTYHILQNPNVLQKFSAELKRAFPCSETVYNMTNEEMRKLPYLVRSSSVHYLARGIFSIQLISPADRSGQRIAPPLLRCTRPSPSCCSPLWDYSWRHLHPCRYGDLT